MHLDTINGISLLHINVNDYLQPGIMFRMNYNCEDTGDLSCFLQNQMDTSLIKHRILQN